MLPACAVRPADDSKRCKNSTLPANCTTPDCNNTRGRQNRLPPCWDSTREPRSRVRTSFVHCIQHTHLDAAHLTTTVHTRFMLADEDETSQENSELVLTSGGNFREAIATLAQGIEIFATGVLSSAKYRYHLEIV